jgi:hypothetical protein
MLDALHPFGFTDDAQDGVPLPDASGAADGENPVPDRSPPEIDRCHPFCRQKPGADLGFDPEVVNRAAFLFVLFVLPALSLAFSFALSPPL